MNLFSVLPPVTAIVVWDRAKVVCKRLHVSREESAKIFAAIFFSRDILRRFKTVPNILSVLQNCNGVDSKDKASRY